MSPETKEFLEKRIYPIIRDKVREQLNVKELPISVNLTVAFDEERGNVDCLDINDGQKMLMIPILTPDMVNVTREVDTIWLKQYLLSDDKNADQKGSSVEIEKK